MEVQKYQAKTESYIHRSVAGNDVLISVGANVARFNGYIELNPAGAVIWDTLKNPSTIEEIAEILVSNFGIPMNEAAEDTAEFIRELLDHEMVTKV